MMTVAQRFLKYTGFETTSCEMSESCPSTPGQMELARALVEELQEMGVTDARVDAHGYVYASIPPKGDHPAKVGLIAHMDTSDGVKGPTHAQVISNYDGKAVTLKNGVVIDGFDFLESLKGQDLIVTDGESVLGADDKAGVAEIMALAALLTAPDAPEHCGVCIAFTPDEEIGRGADLFDVAGFGADYAYTVDGGSLGGLDYESFNAASAKVEVTGVSTHTGGAKGRMVNSMKVAMEYCDLLPKGQAPEYTEGREGFFHVDSIQGNVEYTLVQFLIRDHDKDLFQQKKELMKQAAAYINAKYPTHPLTLTVEDSYYNMKEKILPQKEILENMEQAMRENGVEPHSEPVRGGTDGARLSYEGLPCPNLCTGGYNAHSRTEYVVLEEMETIKDIIKTAIYRAE